MNLAQLFGPLGYRGMSQPHRQSARRNPHRGARGGGNQRMKVSKHAAIHRELAKDGILRFPRKHKP